MTKVYFKKFEEYELEELKVFVRDCFSKLNIHFKENASVLVKPNFLLAKSANSPVITNPILIRAVLEVLIEMKMKPFIYEMPSVGSVEIAAKKCGVWDICQELNVSIKPEGSYVSLSNDYNKYFKKLFFPKEVEEADYIINLAKLKTHSLMGLTMGVKNIFGLVKKEYRHQMHFKTGRDRNKFAHMLIDIYNIVKPDLTIIDAIVGMEGEGPSNGEARKFNFVCASEDAYVLDTEVAKILNVNIDKVPILKVGKNRFDRSSVEYLGDEIIIDRIVTFPSTFDSNDTLLNMAYPLLKRFIEAKPKINRDKCISCFNCKNTCPAKAISIIDNKPFINDNICVKCFCCHEVCPINAIKIDKPYIGRFLEKRFDKSLKK